MANNKPSDNKLKNEDIIPSDSKIISTGQIENNINQENEMADGKGLESQTEMNPIINYQYNFSIKYPVNFFDLGLFELPSAQRPVIAEQSFSNKNVSSPMEMSDNDIWVSIRISENKDNLTLKQWAESIPTNPQGTLVLKKQEITINDLPAVRQIEDFLNVKGTESGFSEVVYLQDNNFVYSIKGLTSSEKVLNSFQNDFNNIVNSFKIIN
ncbi:MAG: hypothetical protein WCZ90_19495 [Melioribacteraceae bacterium]